MAGSKTRSKGTLSSVASPSYNSFPAPATSENNPFSPENIAIRQQKELGQLESEQKSAESKKKDKTKKYKAFTSPRYMSGGDTTALQVLASLSDSPVIRAFIAASGRRKI